MQSDETSSASSSSSSAAAAAATAVSHKSNSQRVRDDRSHFAPSSFPKRRDANATANHVFASPSRSSQQQQQNNNNNNNNNSSITSASIQHHQQSSPILENHANNNNNLNVGSQNNNQQQLNHHQLQRLQQQQQQRGSDERKRDLSNLTPATEIGEHQNVIKLGGGHDETSSDSDSEDDDDDDSDNSSSSSCSSSSASSSATSSEDDDDDTSSDSSRSNNSNRQQQRPSGNNNNNNNQQNRQQPPPQQLQQQQVHHHHHSSSSHHKPFRAGDLVGANRFEVKSELGRGAFSTVYLIQKLRNPPPPPTAGGVSNSNDHSHNQQPITTRRATSAASSRVQTPPSNNNCNNGGIIHEQQLAMKVFKSGKKFDSCAMHEWDTIQALTFALGKHSGFLSTEVGFRSRNLFSCLCLPLAGPNLLQILKLQQQQQQQSSGGGGGGGGLPELYVKSIAHQVLHFCAQAHNIGICVTDLKPENIVFTHRGPGMIQSSTLPIHSQVAVIDFSNAVFRFKDLSPQQQAAIPDDFPLGRNHEEGPQVIQTRHYRAPEVLFQTPRWSFPADVWSVGCILMEMITGNCTFMTHEDAEHIAMIWHVIGPMSRELVSDLSSSSSSSSSQNKQSKFSKLIDTSSSSSSSSRPVWPNGVVPNVAASDIEYVKRMPTLENICMALQTNSSSSSSSTTTTNESSSSSTSTTSMSTKKLLFDLLSRLLDWDPRKRISAASALHHPFFTS